MQVQFHVYPFFLGCVCYRKVKIIDHQAHVALCTPDLGALYRFNVNCMYRAGASGRGDIFFVDKGREAWPVFFKSLGSQMTRGI